MADPAYWLDAAWNAGLVLLLVLLNGFFVAAEFAIVKVRESQLQARAKTPARGAALHIVHHLDAYLSACQLGITLASLGLGWVGEPIVARFFVKPVLGGFLTDPDALRAVSFGVAFALITVLHIVLGELAPKTIAIRKAERTALAVALPLRLFRRVFSPFIWLLNGSANLLVRALGVKPSGAGDEHSVDELRLLLTRAATTSKKGAARSAEVAGRVFKLQDLEVRDVMVARDRMVVLDVQNSFEENLAVAEKHPFARFPLTDGGVDSVLGFIHHRDLFLAMRKAPRPRLEDLRREVLVVPTTQRVDRTLFQMLEKRRSLAIVVNEFGTTVGMLTHDDIFEELVGDIPEDYERVQSHLRIIAPGYYLVDGAMPLHELQVVLREPVADQRAATVAGMLINAAGRIPVKGETIRIGSYAYWVKEADRHKVRMVEVRRVEPEPDATGGETPETPT